MLALPLPTTALWDWQTGGQGKTGAASELERSIELPKQKQRFSMEMLETVLAQANG